VPLCYDDAIEHIGYAPFAANAKKVDVAGVLLVDRPREEAGEVFPVFKESGIDTIFLIAPSTTLQRAAKISAHASGYLYYVAVKGVTGSATLDVAEVGEKLADMRKLTDVPLAVGVGIRDGASASAVSQVADGVIVGSVLVNCIAEMVETPEKIAPALQERIKEMRLAMEA